MAICDVSKINIVGSLLYFDKLCAVCTMCVSIAVTCISKVRFYRCYMYFRFAFLLVHHVCQSTSCSSHKVTCVNKLHCQILLVFIRSGRAPQTLSSGLLHGSGFRVVTSATYYNLGLSHFSLSIAYFIFSAIILFLFEHKQILEQSETYISYIVSAGKKYFMPVSAICAAETGFCRQKANPVKQ